jgi:hypothetical protein
MPVGWEIDPNWDSNASVWDEMIDPEDAPKASGKKWKKRAHDSEPQSGGWLAARDKAMREYLAPSTSHTVIDKTLKRELRMAYHSFALQEAERAKNVIVPTPQFTDLTVRPRYPGEGEPLPHGDPPIPVTGRLPRPLGRSVPRTAEWYDVCPLDDIQFQELYELAKVTPPAERMQEMIATFRSVQAQRRIDNPKPKQFGIHPSTPGDMAPTLQSCQCNLEGVPLPICGESDGTLNTSDVDVWMWLKWLSPKSRPINSTMWTPLINLFSEPGRWSGLVDPWECLTPQTENLRGSVTAPFPINGRDTSTIPHSEIARWLATYGGLTPDRVPRIEAYAMRHVTKLAYNSAATEGQQKMKKAATRTAKRTPTKVSATSMVTAEQLDRELAADRPPSPPPDPAASAAWHQDNDLAVPDHLPADPGLTTQEAGPSTEPAPTESAGTPHPDPRPTPAPYTDVPKEDVEEVVDYEPSS